MIRSLHYTPSGQIRNDLSLDEIRKIIASETGLLWLDLVAEEPASSQPILQDVFGFHPLAVSDALDEQHVPRVDDWSTYLYLVLHALDYDKTDDTPLHTFELDIFLSKHFLVTYQAQPIPIIDRIWDQMHRDTRFIQQGTDHLFYKLADELIADYMNVVEKLDERIDQIEDRVFGNPSQEILEKIFSTKRSLLHLRRIIAPQREVFNKLARGDDTVIDPADRVFFRDVYDHLVRLYDITENLRDLVAGVLDTYLSVVNNRMNEVMKTLTIITTIFMPLSFLAGFFGMNFFLPEQPVTAWMQRPIFTLVIAAFVIVPVFMYWWMRRRKWM